MNPTIKTMLAATLFGALSIASQVQAATMPCEDMLKDYRAAKASVKLGNDVMKQADALEAKAVERCNADDDKRADEFLKQATTLIGK